jgi:hypothetical protein
MKLHKPSLLKNFQHFRPKEANYTVMVTGSEPNNRNNQNKVRCEAGEHFMKKEGV